MVNNNRLQSIWTGLARSIRYNAYVVEEDISSFLRRSGSEGPEYYARALTTLRADLLNGIETGQLTVTGRFGLKRNTALPRFMYRAFNMIFREEDGVLRATYDVGAVSCLNQLLAVFGKISGGHTPASENTVISSFLSDEEDLASSVINESLLVSKVPLRHILDQARNLVSRVLAREDPREIHPKHGSGSSACSTAVRRRYETPRYIKSIDAIWPMTEFYFANASHLVDHLDEWMNVTEYDPMAKVLLVPKDSKGPRLISCEPRETMFIQLGLMQKMYDCIEGHPLTRGSVNFTDQTHNQRAAKLGSQDRSIATLDLTRASDRFRLDLMQRIFPTNWSEALTACRSGSTQLPSGQVVHLAKHAPMGSACCFPVMALGIWAVLTAALPPRSEILVYGDDIVVPSQHAALAIVVLEALHLRVNTAKSYVQGPFRESCGKEYIDGVDITPVRLRANPTSDSAARDKTIAFSNNMFEKFGLEPYWLTVLIKSWYRDVLERTHDPKTSIPIFHCEIISHWKLKCRLSHEMNRSLSGVLNVTYADNKHLRRRRCSNTGVLQYYVRRAKSVEVSYSIDSWSQLYRALVNPRFDVPLGSDALPKRVSYKYRWFEAPN